MQELPPQCTSTPYNGLTKRHPHTVAASSASTTPAPKSLAATTADKAAAVPPNISININMNSPIKSQPPTTASTNSMHASRRISIHPPATIPTITEHPSPIVSSVSRSNRSAEGNRSPVVEFRLPSVPTTPTRLSQRQQQQPHPSTPRPSQVHSLRTHKELSLTPRSLADREQLLHTLRQKCAEKERATASIRRSNVAAEMAQDGKNVPVAVAAVRQAVDNEPPPKPSPVERTYTATVLEPAIATVVPSSSAAANDAHQTQYDISQYIRNVAASDVIQDNSPTTSQTLRHNMMNRERKTLLENKSLRPMSRITRPKTQVSINSQLNQHKIDNMLFCRKILGRMSYRN